MKIGHKIDRFDLYLRHPPVRAHVTAATAVAISAAIIAHSGIATPSIPTLVKVAKIPPVGVKPPYIQDWNAAARDPIEAT